MTPSILIIDDDLDLTELVADLFVHNTLKAISTNLALEGIELTRSISPDLIIVDLKMPDMDGFEVCNQIRSFSNVPILVLSASSNPVDPVRILDAGADDFLQKPVNPTILLAHVKNLIRRSNQVKGLNT